MASRLRIDFEQVPVPTDDATAFMGRRLDGTNLRLARSRRGSPALLVPPSSGRGIHLSNLTFTPRLVCNVSQADGARSKEEVGVLECSSDDSELHRYFLHLVATLVDTYRHEGEGSLQEALEHIAELFRAIQLPGQRTTQGLWCELFMLANAPDKATACAGWHASPRDLYDFSAQHQRVEVKSSSTGVRSHRFSLEQLSPAPAEDVVVASFLLSPADSGTSILDLWSVLHEALPGAQRMHLERQIAAALGSDWRSLARVGYDAAEAASSLQLYDARELPRVSADIPVDVSEVRFRSDLTRSPVVAADDLRARGGLFEALIASDRQRSLARAFTNGAQRATRRSQRANE